MARPPNTRTTVSWQESDGGTWQRGDYVVVLVAPYTWDVMRNGRQIAREPTASAAKERADADRHRTVNLRSLQRNGALFALAVAAAVVVAGVIQRTDGGLPLWALPGLIVAVGLAIWSGVGLTLAALRLWWRAIGRKTGRS